MKTVDNEAGVKFARKGYYKGVEVTVTHRYGSQVWLEDYPIRHKGGPTEWGCWVEGESVTYKDNFDDDSANEQPSNREPTSIPMTLKKPNAKNNQSNKKPNNKYKSGKTNTSPKGNNGSMTRNRRGSARNS